MKRPNMSRSKASTRSRRSCPILALKVQNRLDEDDSGLGDTSNFDDSSNFSAASLFSEHAVSLQEQSCASNSMGSFPQSYDPSHAIGNKRLRLDIPEEANELPEQTYFDPTTQQLTSFKNVPALLSPVNNLFTTPIEPVHEEAPLRRKTPRQEKVTKKSSRRQVNEGIPAVSSDGKIEIRITAPPEKQHRARYQTEGSRGSVKGEGSAGHPVVKILGYSKPCVVECFVACSEGHVVPHMFYQACQVNGKNSTPCEQSKQDGVTYIKMTAHPDNHMTIICDCVGILKERNVDVEQRLNSSVAKGRKKNTKCRLVFRTVVLLESGLQETIQVASDSICCSQPLGVPEISRKSLEESPAEGGRQLFIIGKNFLKNTKVIFREVQGGAVLWEQIQEPDKELLNSGHLICQIPRYPRPIEEPVQVQLIVSSDNKQSEPHKFEYVGEHIGDSIRHGPKEMKFYPNSIGKSTDDASPLTKQPPHHIHKRTSIIPDAVCDGKIPKAVDSNTARLVNEVLAVARMLKQSTSMDPQALKELLRVSSESIFSSLCQFVNMNQPQNILRSRPSTSRAPLPMDPKPQMTPLAVGTQTKQVVPQGSIPSKDILSHFGSEDGSESTVSWQPPEIADLNAQEGYPDLCHELNGLKGEMDMFNKDLGTASSSRSSPDSDTHSVSLFDMKPHIQDEPDPVLPQFNLQPELSSLKLDSTQFIPDENLSLADLPDGDIIDYFPLDKNFFSALM